MELLFDSNFAALSGQRACLCPDESLHCVKVMRHRVGDQIFVTDGKGLRYVCRLAVADSRGCELDVESIDEMQAPSHFLHMAVAPTKNTDRFEWFVEKAVELGVSRITPIACDHSERVRLRLDRIERLVVAACKQSLKYHVPVVDDVSVCSDVIANATEEQLFILHCEDSPKSHLFAAAQPARSSLVLIGPEGDFSAREISLARQNRFLECSLGPERLRTETAALAATHIIDLKNQI